MYPQDREVLSVAAHIMHVERVYSQQ